MDPTCCKLTIRVAENGNLRQHERFASRGTPQLLDEYKGFALEEGYDIWRATASRGRVMNTALYFAPELSSLSSEKYRSLVRNFFPPSC
jgi:hypothetical protein